MNANNVSFGVGILLLVAVIVLLTQKRTEPFEPLPRAMRALDPNTITQDRIIVSDNTASLSTVSIYDMAFPPKTILMWNDKGQDTPPPNGWLLCDGTQGTPNLKYRFPVGLDSSDSSMDTLNSRSDESENPTDVHQLTSDQIPAHTHGYTSIRRTDTNDNSDSGSDISCVKNSPDEWLTDGFTTGETGKDKPHNNMPPYIVVKFIMKQ